MGFIVWLCLLASCGVSESPPPLAKAGVLDLRGWDFAQNGTLRLDGEWQWYWKELRSPLLSPAQAQSSKASPNGYFPVPYTWNGMVVDGKPLSGAGYATFQLRIILPQNGRYGIIARLCSGAFRLYWNGEELAQSGKLGQGKKDTVPGCRMSVPILDARQLENTITLQVANYHHSRAGFRASLIFGLAEEVVPMWQRRAAFDAFLFGGLWLIILFSVTMFLLRRQDPTPLYLGFFCVVVAMWIGMQGSLLFTILFPSATWNTLVHVEYLGLFLAPMGFGLMLRSLYPREAPRWLIEPFMVVYGALALCVLILPPLLFTRLLALSSVVVILFTVICTGIATHVALRGRSDSVLIIIGFLPMCCGVIADSVIALWPWKLDSITPAALLFLILTLALLLSRRTARAQALIEEQTRTLVRLNAAYYRFVPKEFLRLLGKEDILSVRIGDQVQREMTVLFADVRGFTAMSERMSPQENFAFVNLLLGGIGPLIREHHGFIDKYLGDGVMALFPRQPEDAVHAALKMCQSLDILNQQRAQRGEPAVRIGIGIHTGSIMLGTVGEPQRMDGTVISDVVNTASRLESLSKIYGAAVLLSEGVVAALPAKLAESTRILGRVRAKGKAQPLTVYEFFAGDARAIIASKCATRARFAEGLACFQQGDFCGAALHFQEVQAQDPDDIATRYYCRRAAELKKQQQLGLHHDWDGVEVITEK